MKTGLVALVVLCSVLCAGKAHALAAFPGDQDTIHLYPFVCAPSGADAADTVGTASLQNQGGVTYPQGSGAGFCSAYSASGASRLVTSTNAPGSFGTIVFTVTFLNHATPGSFIDWRQVITFSYGWHVFIFRDATSHMCISTVGSITCSSSTYSDGVEYHFAATYDEGNNYVKLYDSANSLLFSKSFEHIDNPSFTGFAMGGINTDFNPGSTTLLSQVFIENRPWTDQEVQSYFNNFAVGASSNSNKPATGQTILNGSALAGVPVLRLNANLARQELAVTDAAGNYFFATVSPTDYIMPVSSGTLTQTDNLNEGPHGYIFAPNFCRPTDGRGRTCATNGQTVKQNFVASAKPTPLDPPITFNLPLPAGSWKLVTEVGGYILTGGAVDADPSHTNLSTGFYALDIAGQCGTPVLAVADGTVVFAADTPTSAGWGKTVIIRHTDNNLYTRYAHLHSISVKVGTPIGQGQELGLLGSTGLSFGPHVHFQFYHCAAGTLNACGGLKDGTYSQSGDSVLSQVRIDTGSSLALIDFISGATYQSLNASKTRTISCTQ